MLTIGTYVNITGGPEAGKSGQLHSRLPDGRWRVRLVNQRDCLWHVPAEHLTPHNPLDFPSATD